MNLVRLRLAVRHLLEALRLYFGLILLGVGCLLWTLAALPLSVVLSRQQGQWLGRWTATLGFRSYLRVLQIIGLARFDLRELDALRDAGPLILAPNHPGLLDALMVLSRLPNVTCVFKASLINNPLWGAGARLAGYIRNDWFLGSVNLACDALRGGSQLLLFPEGTRSHPWPLGAFQPGVSYVSYRSGAPIQTIIIEQDNQFLGKGWFILTRPDMPMHFSVRLGRRFDPPVDPKAFALTLHEYFVSEVVSLRDET